MPVSGENATMQVILEQWTAQDDASVAALVTAGSLVPAVGFRATETPDGGDSYYGSVVDDGQTDFANPIADGIDALVDAGDFCQLTIVFSGGGPFWAAPYDVGTRPEQYATPASYVAALRAGIFDYSADTNIAQGVAWVVARLDGTHSGARPDVIWVDAENLLKDDNFGTIWDACLADPVIATMIESEILIGAADENDALNRIVAQTAYNTLKAQFADFDCPIVMWTAGRFRNRTRMFKYAGSDNMLGLHKCDTSHWPYNLSVGGTTLQHMKDDLNHRFLDGADFFPHFYAGDTPTNVNNLMIAARDRGVNVCMLFSNNAAEVLTQTTAIASAIATRDPVPLLVSATWDDAAETLTIKWSEAVASDSTVLGDIVLNVDSVIWRNDGMSISGHGTSTSVYQMEIGAGFTTPAVGHVCLQAGVVGA